MRALTLWQPWASLVAAGIKRHETRSWTTKYRGPIAIHAAKFFPKNLGPTWARHVEGLLGTPIYALPSGYVVAVARLVEIVPADDLLEQQRDRWGDYSLGRWVWRLACVEPIAPVPVRGRRGLWEWHDPLIRGIGE